MTEKTLWDVFNLAENNPAPGGGILYCLKYDEGRIKAHQVSVVNALKSIGVGLEEFGERLAVKPLKRLNESEKNRTYALLEELSCLNEALEYSKIGFNQFDSINQLKNGLVTSYFNLLEKNKMVEAYNLVTMVIPQIVRDLRIAHYQNKVLSTSDRIDLADLTNFAQGQDNLLNNTRGFVILGLNK